METKLRLWSCFGLGKLVTIISSYFPKTLSDSDMHLWLKFVRWTWDNKNSEPKDFQEAAAVLPERDAELFVHGGRSFQKEIYDSIIQFWWSFLPPEFYPSEVEVQECSEVCLQTRACVCSTCKCCGSCSATCKCFFATSDPDTALAVLLLGQETEEYL